MVFLMRPADHVQPVLVSVETTVEALGDGLEALGLLGEDLIDPSWIEAGAAALADPARLGNARAGYAAIGADGARAALGAARCAPSCADALEEFFAFLAETAGQPLVIQHLT